MRKNATKIAAMMLSLALTVTSVNVPTTASAASKVKLNKSKATLYLGGASSKKTVTLKATVNGKKVSATFTSNKPKVAKVAKKTGKVTAVKAGTATITAKYNGKKATTKVTVKQYVTSVTSSQATVELKEGEHMNLSELITVAPAGASNKELSYKSDDSLVAAVNAKGTILKGVKEGKTAITVKAKDGSNKSTTVTVNVTAKDDSTTPSQDPNGTPAPVQDGKEAKEVKIAVDNAFSPEYANTLLIGTNAEVKVQVLDEDGKPVANQDVELVSKKVYPTGNDLVNDNINMYQNLTDNVKKTDANGYVTFVYGLNKNSDKSGNAIDATRSDFVARFKVTASVVGKSDINASTDVDFAALTTSAATAINVRNGVTNSGYGVLVPGVNGGSPTAGTIDRNRNSVVYVTSQQVSAAGTDAHAVGFTSGAGAFSLIRPVATSSGGEAADIKETIGFSTEKYSTYTTNTSWAKVIDTVKASQLQYATVNFDKLSLSKYSRFLVRAYLVTNKDNPTAGTGNTITPITLSASEATVAGEKIDGSFSVQIPIEENAEGYLYVTAQVVSKGQVNTKVNEGFTVKNVVGVQKKGSSETVGTATISVPGLSVKWSKDEEATYTMNQELPAGTYKTDLTARYPGCTFQYKVPAFPRTGNAIITVFDNAGKEVAYFAVPTTNEFKGVENGHNVYYNRNVLASGTMYQLSQEEAKNQVGTVESIDGIAKVNSEKSGYTHIIGEITSQNDAVTIDATNRYIYTSVHWNPIPYTAPGTSQTAGQAAAALVGQHIVLKAQLTDMNGNAVSTANVPIKFYKDVKDVANEITANGHAPSGLRKVGEASIISVDTVTNALGQAELVLVSGEPAEALHIMADTENKNFNVNYVVGTETVTKDWVDLYWVDANLYFEPDANSGVKAETTFGAPAVDTKAVASVNSLLEPKVTESWAYEVRTNGDFKSPLGGTLAGCTGIEISGLTIQTAAGTGSVGTVTNNVNGKAEVTSTKAGSTMLVNTLDRNSVGNDVKFTFTGRAGGNVTLINAGTGVPTLDKKLTVSINWKAGVATAEVVIPTGLKALALGVAGAADVPVYVEVKDANGNPLKDMVVTPTITGGGALVEAGPTFTTDKNGIAKFTVSPGADSTTASIAAKVDGLTGTFSSSIKWVTPTLQELKITNVAYDYNDKTIKLTFNNDIYESSVIKELFEVKYDSVEQLVTEATVAANVVTLKIPALIGVDLTKDFEVTVKTDQHKVDNDSIIYNLVSVDAQKLVAPKDKVTFKANETIPQEEQ